MKTRAKCLNNAVVLYEIRKGTFWGNRFLLLRTLEPILIKASKKNRLSRVFVNNYKEFWGFFGKVGVHLKFCLTFRAYVFA